MKVAVCTLSQNVKTPTGALSYFAQIAKFLPEVDPETDYHFIVSDRSRAYISQRSTATMDVVGWDSEHRFLRLFSEHFLLGPWMKAHGIDVLFMANAGVRPLLMPSSVKLVQAIFAFHQFMPGSLNRSQQVYRKLFFDATIKRAERIVLNSQYSHDLLDQYATVDPDIVRIIWHGRNEELFHPGPLSPVEKQQLEKLDLPSPYICYVSQMYPYKNVEIAVEGFCRFVKQTGAPHHFVLIGQFDPSFGEGEAYRQRLIGIAKSHGLEDRLIWRENVPVKALRAVYREADAYVQSSTLETFGRTTIEALACGCPVIAARAAATPEILGDAGLYFEPNDAEGLAASLGTICGDRKVADDYRQRGIARSQLFSVYDEARRLAAVFREVADGGC